MRIARLGAAVIAALFALAPATLAHEHRDAAGASMVVGWGSEPAYAGFPNAVQIMLTDGAGKPITDLGDTLKVEVKFGDQKMGPLALEPAFGKPGDYRAQIVPTRAGNYSFHFTGTVLGRQIDQTFTSSDKTFDPVGAPAELEFPVKDPTNAELGAKLDASSARLTDKTDDASSTATRGAALGGAGIVVGLIGVGLALRRKG